MELYLVDGWMDLLVIFFISFIIFVGGHGAFFFFLPCLTSMIFFSFSWLHILPLFELLEGVKQDSMVGDFIDATPSVGVSIDGMVILLQRINNSNSIQ